MVVYCRLINLLLFFCLFLHASGSRINLVQNGYRDIVVAISPDVPADQADELLDKIKLLITEASADLYEATRHRSYIESVNILIPQTWRNVTANASTWENFQNAEIQVDRPNWQYKDLPYTVQLGGCGDPGKYIHLTPNYLRNFDSNYYKSEFGPAGKVFVREWARLRYGVFEEHGYTGDESPFPMFYQSASQDSVDLIPNVCSDQPVTNNDFNYDYGCRVDPQTGLYDSSCTYSFTDQFKPESSMMSDYRMLSTAMHFCDDEASSRHKHNREAPTKQNAVCDSQSIWSVITRHVDFAGTNNLPANITNLIPTFNVVRVLNGARYVLVSDISSSMATADRSTRLYDSSRRWIKYDIPDGTSLGIIKFSTSAEVLSDMTVVSDATRQQLVDTIPNEANGTTCIGCGLQKAIDILSPSGNGGVIVLVTDGIQNVHPYINEVYPQLIAAQVQVVSIAFGRDAENEIEVLATKTDGKSFFIDDDISKDGLEEAFTGSLSYLPTVPLDDLTIVLHQESFSSRGTYKNSTIVDFTVGVNLTFRLDYTTINNLQSFSVVSPSGQVYDILDQDHACKLASIVIPGVAEEGAWNFTLVVSSSTTGNVNLRVTSKSKIDSGPITVECSVPSGSVCENAAIKPVILVAVVKQGRNSVIGAHVQAHIERPDAALQVINLVDNGVGADKNGKNDGTYSRYYIDPTNAGRYTLVCVVTSAELAFINDGKVGQRTTVGDFNRVQSGGAFRVEIPLVTPYAPSRVTDLKIVAIQVNQMSFTIEWTATGQQLDQGIASGHKIKYSEVFDNLLDSNFDSNLSVQFEQQDVLDGSLDPLESGSKQRVTLALPKTTDDITYYIALRALNSNNAASSTSNIVSVQIVPVKPPQTQSPTTRQTTKAPESPTSAPGCNSVLTGSSGLLTSPNFPGPYPNNYDCQWIIRVASASKIKLNFSHFDIESSKDYVEVYDGASISPVQLLLKHSGSTVPGPVVSSSNEMLVRFVTDGMGNYFNGWGASYTSS